MTRMEFCTLVRAGIYVISIFLNNSVQLLEPDIQRHIRFEGPIKAPYRGLGSYR